MATETKAKESGDKQWVAKIALVTGGNKGIGIEVVRALAKSGMTVFLAARNKALGEAATRSLVADKLDVRFVELDVTKSASIEAARDHVAKTAGRLDLLVNNSGIIVPLNSEKKWADTLRETYEVNVFGLVSVTEAFLPLLDASTAKPARVVNVSSSLGSLAGEGPKRCISFSPTFSSLSYGNSKTALNGLNVAMNMLFERTKHDVILVSVCPGFTATDLNNNTGTQTPEFAAAIVVKYSTGYGDGKELAGGYFDINGKYPF